MKSSSSSSSISSLAVLPLLVATGVALGLGLPLAKLAAMQGVQPLPFATWPTWAAALVLVALGAGRQGPPPAPQRLLRFGLIAGLFGHAAPMTALYWLTRETGAGFAALAFTLPPVFTLAITLALRLQAPSALRLGAVVVGLAGALLLVLGRDVHGPASWLPLLAVVAIPASMGGANVYRSLHLPAGTGGEWLSAATLLGSAAILTAGGLAAGALGVPQTPAALLILAAQTAVLVAGYLLYFALQRRAEPVTFSFMGYVSMGTGVLAGLLMFQEVLPWTTLPALALIVLSLKLIVSSRPPAATAGAPR